MLPSIDLRIDNLLKALEQVILPALPDSARLAQEQVRLVAGHLAIIKSQWKHALRFESGSLDTMIDLARTLAGAVTEAQAHGLQTALAAVDGTDRHDLAAIEGAVGTLGKAVDAVILGDDGRQPLSVAARRAIMDYGRRQSLRERAWFVGHGLDPDKGELPPIDAIP